MNSYRDKVCVATGATSGIGKALCEKLVALKLYNTSFFQKKLAGQ